MVLLSDAMPTMNAEFDGRVFVPCCPVDLPAGTCVEVMLPQVPRAPTAEEHREWQHIRQEIAATAPAFPTVEKAMEYSRKRPPDAA
jgi:hypothetical protein